MAPQMEHGHFELIAAALRKTAPGSSGAKERWFDTVQDMAETLTDTNPNFNRVRFIAACKPREVTDDPS